MIEGLLSYDYDKDVWFLTQNDGKVLEVNGIVYNLIALGLDNDIEEGKQVKISINLF